MQPLQNYKIKTKKMLRMLLGVFLWHQIIESKKRTLRLRCLWQNSPRRWWNEADLLRSDAADGQCELCPSVRRWQCGISLVRMHLTNYQSASRQNLAVRPVYRRRAFPVQRASGKGPKKGRLSRCRQHLPKYPKDSRHRTIQQSQVSVKRAIAEGVCLEHRFLMTRYRR